MPAVVSTPPGDATVNSYLSVAEAQLYWDTKLFTSSWDDSPDQDAAVILASRTIDAALAGRKQFYPANGVMPAHFVTNSAWTGARASVNAGKLAWPRSGMLDRNGVAIAETVIPQELKDAVAELAGQLSKEDRSLDNDVAAKGITSITAGPVSLAFAKDGAAFSKPIPEAVWDLLVPSWLSDEVYEPAQQALFDTVSAGSEEGINQHLW